MGINMLFPSSGPKTPKIEVVTETLEPTYQTARVITHTTAIRTYLRENLGSHEISWPAEQLATAERRPCTAKLMKV
jgi:hypothetical protein